MAHEIGVVLRADPKPYESAIDRLKAATDDWELSTAAGAEDVDEKFAEVIRALVDMGKQGGRTEADMEKMLRGIGLSSEDASDALKAIERETSDIGQKAPRDLEQASDAVDDIGTAAEDAGDKTSTIGDKAGEVGEGLRSLGDIARDVMSGDFASAAEGAIGALGSIAGAIGGGVIGGAIASAVAGIASGWIASWDDAATQSEDRVNTWADRFIEAQGRVLTEQQIMSEVERLLTEDAEKVAKAWEIAAVTGQTHAEVLRGLAGDTDALSASQKGLSDAAADAQAKIDAYNESGGRAGPTALEARDSIKALADELATQSTEMDTAAGKANLYAEAAELGKTKTDDLAHSISELQTDKTVKLTVAVDDSAWRLWKPSKKFAEVVAVGGAGGGRQLIQ